LLTIYSNLLLSIHDADLPPWLLLASHAASGGRCQLQAADSVACSAISNLTADARQGAVVAVGVARLMRRELQPEADVREHSGTTWWAHNATKTLQRRVDRVIKTKYINL